MNGNPFFFSVLLMVNGSRFFFLIRDANSFQTADEGIFFWSVSIGRGISIFTAATFCCVGNYEREFGFNRFYGGTAVSKESSAEILTGMDTFSR